MLPKPHVPAAAEKYPARIIGPTEINIPAFVYQGMVLPIAADLPDGGFLQIVAGENPMGQAVPGMPIPKGAMVALILPEQAAQIRPVIREVDKKKDLKILPA